MNTHKYFPLVLLSVSLTLAANLQPRDILFVSTHKRPVQVVSDDRQAFVLTEGGILMYDYRRSAWVDNIHMGLQGERVRGLYLPKDRGMLWVDVGGRYLEYNPTFQRFTDAGRSLPGGDLGLGREADLIGLVLNEEYFFLGDGIRDRYMRRASLTQARVFDYDNLWVLTDGLGPFLGSARRKDAASVWFGLDNPDVTAMALGGDRIWFGSCEVEGALISARSANLGDWNMRLARKEQGFVHGCVHDIFPWRDYIWLASEHGVVRHRPNTRDFRHYDLFQGGSGVRINRLHNHVGALFAATQSGVSRMANPDEGFVTVPTPEGIDIPVNALGSNGPDLLVGTRYGVYIRRGEKWNALKDFTPESAPSSYGIDVPDITYHGGALYWLARNQVMVKPKGKSAHPLLQRDQPTRLEVHDNLLFVAFRSGVTVFNLQNNLWTDFRLEDGIPGSQVRTFLVEGDFLWVATDAGATRIRIRAHLP